MKRHYECPPVRCLVGSTSTLIFDWDSETGEISGPSAEEIKRRAKPFKQLDRHPRFNVYQLSAEPLKSKADMAAIVGFNNVLPDDLKPYYPKQIPTWPDVPPETYIDENGVMILGLDKLMF